MRVRCTTWEGTLPTPRRYTESIIHGGREGFEGGTQIILRECLYGQFPRNCTPKLVSKFEVKTRNNGSRVSALPK